jgi:tellurite resistance protein
LFKEIEMPVVLQHPTDSQKTHLALLLGMMASDGKITQDEKNFLISTAMRLGFSSEDFLDLCKDVLAEKIPIVTPITKSERADILLDIFLMMMSDGDVNPQEKRAFRYSAAMLGFGIESVDKLLNHLETMLAIGEVTPTFFKELKNILICNAA